MKCGIYMLAVLLLIVLDYSPCIASDVVIGYNKNYPTINSTLIALKKKLAQNNKQHFDFISSDIDSDVLQKLLNFQTNAAILPINEFKNIFFLNRRASGKFMLWGVIGELDVGYFIDARCSKFEKISSNSRIYLNPSSNEYTVYKLKFKENSEVLNKNFFEQLEYMNNEHHKSDCHTIIWGSPRYTSYLKNKKSWKFIKVGNLPLAFFVNDLFASKRANELHDFVVNYKTLDGKNAKSELDFDQMKKLLIEFNSDSTNFNEERLNAFIKN